MHTFAVLQGEEDYNHMSEGLAPILDEINDVIENNNVVLNGQNFKLKFFGCGLQGTQQNITAVTHY